MQCDITGMPRCSPGAPLVYVPLGEGAILKLGDEVHAYDFGVSECYAGRVIDLTEDRAVIWLGAGETVVWPKQFDWELD